MAVSWSAMGLAIGKAAQQKTVRLLHQRLAAEGVYVGEIIVLAPVKGTAFDRGNATLEASTIADRFFEMSERRDQTTVMQS
jgi:hypothetical protein